jgi:hypothetical protein
LAADDESSKAIVAAGAFDVFKDRIARHSYSLGCMVLWLSFVLVSSNSLRSAALNLKIVSDFLGLNLSTPTWYSGRLWLQRLGYYKLMRPKVIAPDWVWIVDHSVQSGQEKCLVILGIRLSDLPEVGQCLRHEDMEPIELIPVKQSDGRIVYQQLEEACQKTGIPRAILGDEGPDLKAGIERFRESHPETVRIYDIKHKTASLLKGALNDDEAWEAFKDFAAQSKKQVQQTGLAHLGAPNQRSKARYMNLEQLIEWAKKMLPVVRAAQAELAKAELVADKESKESDPHKEAEEIVRKLGRLMEFADDLEEWDEMMQIISIAESMVRQQGLKRNIHKRLEAEIKEKLPRIKSQKARWIKGELLSFVKAQQKLCRPGERLPGSSEVIESVFGKQKRLENEQSRSGFTGLVLAIGALVSTTTREVVKTALETVKTEDVISWCKEKIGQTVQAKRKAVFSTA